MYTHMSHMCTYIYIYIYTYIHTYTYLPLSLSLSIYIYIYIHPPKGYPKGGTQTVHLLKVLYN